MKTTVINRQKIVVSHSTDVLGNPNIHPPIQYFSNPTRLAVLYQTIIRT
ncbi:hypothetical protein YPPY58_3054, partial [Yersinia pestis PY-58]